MTNEKREAIEYLERQIRVCNENAEICDNNNFDEEATHLREESYMLHTALSLIKEQQEEIEKKDKQIDLMAEMIDELSEYYTRYHGKNNEFCKEIRIEKDIDCRDCIKQYFERKAEDEK